MLRQVLSASALLALLAGVSACGSDDKTDSGAQPSASASETPGESASATPTDAPSPAWKQSPGQSDKVKAMLTGSGFACSELKDPYATFRLCSKQIDGDLVWIKFIGATDGTVVSAKMSSFKDVKPAITAIVGAGDANVLLASGDTIKWGYAGDNWVTINGMNSAFEPPQAEPFENSRADIVRVFQDDSQLRCKVEDPSPAATTPADPNEITPSMSATPAVPSFIECQPRGYDANKVVWATMTFAGDKLTEFTMRSEMNDLSGNYTKQFAAGKAQLLRSLNRLWPALKGGDVQAIKTFVEAHLTPTGSALAYIDGRRVRVDNFTGRSNGSAAKLKIEVTNEKVDLAENG